MKYNIPMSEVYTLYIIASVGCSGSVILRQFNPIVTLPLKQ